MRPLIGGRRHKLASVADQSIGAHLRPSHLPSWEDDIAERKPTHNGNHGVIRAKPLAGRESNELFVAENAKQNRGVVVAKPEKPSLKSGIGKAGFIDSNFGSVLVPSVQLIVIMSVVGKQVSTDFRNSVFNASDPDVLSNR